VGEPNMKRGRGKEGKVCEKEEEKGNFLSTKLK
jgi:hypothetical protein